VREGRKENFLRKSLLDLKFLKRKKGGRERRQKAREGERASNRTLEKEKKVIKKRK